MKLAFLSAAALLASCASSQPTQADHERVISYERELEDAERACVADASTPAQSHACRVDAKARINAKYGRPAP